MLNREEEYKRLNELRDKDGQAHFPDMKLGPLQMDPSPKRKGRWSL